MDKKSKELGGDLVSEGIIICVYESAFDVLIPEYGFEKRVHCDQLPLKKAEYRKEERVLELYWEKGVPSSAYVPEDERPRASASTRGNNNTRIPRPPRNVPKSGMKLSGRMLIATPSRPTMWMPFTTMIVLLR